MFARKPLPLWFKRKVINKQKGDFTRFKRNSINNFIMNVKVNICFASNKTITIILSHFSKQYITAMVRIFCSNILRLLTSNQLWFLTSNHVIPKCFFQELRFEPTLKYLEKNHFIMSKSLYIWIKNPCHDNMLLWYENWTNHDDYKFIRKSTLSFKLLFKLIKNMCILLAISFFCFFIILFLNHNWNASLARKYLLRY